MNFDTQLAVSNLLKTMKFESSDERIAIFETLDDKYCHMCGYRREKLYKDGKLDLDNMCQCGE